MRLPPSKRTLTVRLVTCLTHVVLSCTVYLDGILIYSQDEEHVGHVRAVLERLRRFKLYAKLSKRAFHTDSMDFLGYIINT